jgi:NTE family protein
MNRGKSGHGLLNAAVVFSSGFFGFYAHAGFLSALRELGVRPSAYGGSSSGAIVAAMAAAGMSDREIMRILFNLKKQDFWDPDSAPFLLKKIFSLFKGYTGFLKGKGFARLLQEIPVTKIEDCETPLAIAATDLTKKREKIFVSGNLIEAIHASGAVPLMFKPVAIGDSLYADGGVVAKAPLISVCNLTNAETVIVHMIPSQGVEGEGNGFLDRRFTPWHLHFLAYNIARAEAYRRELELVRQKGIKVFEVKTNPPSLGPNKLKLGPRAYRSAKSSAVEILKGFMQR